MQLPVDIRFIGMEHSGALEAAARDRIAHAERLCPRAMGWRVAIEQPHRHAHEGRLFRAHVHVTLPGWGPADANEDGEDAYVALRDAFAAIERAIGRITAGRT